MSRLSLKNDFKDGEVLYGNQINTNNNATVAAVNDNYEKIQSLDNLKADVSNVNSQLATKVDVSTFNDSINSLTTTKADVSLVNTKADKSELAAKADVSMVEQGLANKADTSYVNTQLSAKADTSYVNTQLSTKADKETTYTKEETDAAINSSVSNKADVTYVNSQVATKANASDLGDLSDLETTNKSSAVAAINEVLNEGTSVSNIDYLTITKNASDAIQTVGVLDKNGAGYAVKTWTGTKEEYDALETKDANTLYYITDDYEEPEVKSNKVTNINSTNTDEEYPSAKAVYDAIQDVSGGGTTNYEVLINKPQINGVTLSGNKTSADLGIKQTYTANDIAFTDGETFQQKYDAGELTGPKGDTGDTGPQGVQGETGPAGQDGANATINGQNTLNILAGTNISLDQQGTDLTINATGGSGGGATYTAGTNIEITEENVINNTIPYTDDGVSIFLGNVTFDYEIGDLSVLIGKNMSLQSSAGYQYVGIGSGVKVHSQGVAIGCFAGSVNAINSVAIGRMANVQSNSVSIGAQANVAHQNSIAIGKEASTTQTNQFIIGSTNSPINVMNVVTEEGTKEIATTDLIEALEARIATLEAKVAALEGGGE